MKKQKCCICNKQIKKENTIVLYCYENNKKDYIKYFVGRECLKKDFGYISNNIKSAQYNIKKNILHNLSKD